jgi:hypothetical protein
MTTIINVSIITTNEAPHEIRLYIFELTKLPMRLFLLIRISMKIIMNGRSMPFNTWEKYIRVIRLKLGKKTGIIPSIIIPVYNR